MDIEFFLQLTVNGILLGGFYAAMTLGFSIIWGVMRLINLAHGEFLLMAAYIAWFFFNPNREQNLVIGSETPAEIQSTIDLVFVGIAIVVALIISEIIISQRYVTHMWQARLIGFPAAAIATFGVYKWWESDDFAQKIVPMSDILHYAIALSLGFVLSHFIFAKVLDVYRQYRANEPPWLKKYEIWIRRFIAYPLAFWLVWEFFDRWGKDGFEALDPYEIVPILLLIFFALGYVMQRGLFNRLVEGPYLTMLLVTFAVKIILQSIGLRIYAADPRKISPSYSGAFWTRADITNGTFRVPATGIKLPNPLAIIPETAFPDVTIPQDKSYVIVISAIMIVALVLFLRRTRTGYAIRAAAQNKNAARLVGINIHETYAITFGIALAMTAVAGALMGTFQPITPVRGATWTLRAFAIVALGGLGRVQGVVVGGLILGLTESYIGGYVPRLNDAISQIEIVNATGWAIAASFIILVIMLVVRPQGITGGLVLEDE